MVEVRTVEIWVCPKCERPLNEPNHDATCDNNWEALRDGEKRTYAELPPIVEALREIADEPPGRYETQTERVRALLAQLDPNSTQEMHDG